MPLLDHVTSDLKNEGISPGDTILDVGFGDIEELKLLASLVKPHGSVIGLDVDLENIQRIEKRLARRHSTIISVKKGSVTDIPSPDQKFDFVFCKAVLHEILSIDKALEEIVRVLKPDGCMVIIDFMQFSMIEFKLYKALTSLFGNQDAHPGFDPVGLKQILSDQPMYEINWDKLPYKGHLGFSDKDLFLLKARKK